MVILEAKAVEKKFGSFTALAGLDLAIERGECVGLLGPNGAGKSTFIGAVYGVVERSSGSLHVFGLDPRINSREIKRRLGVVPQENALDEGLTVRENLALYAAFVGVPRAERKQRIDDLLLYMNLDHRADAAIRTLSGGMKRRLAFVRALLSHPELVILDEPTTGLDPAVRQLLWQKVTELKEQGKTILVTTHYMHEAEVLCDRVVILNQGKIIDSGSPRALIDRHTPGFVAIFSKNKFAETSKTSLPNSWQLIPQRAQTLVRAPTLPDLIEFQEREKVNAEQLRPANLEDVFLKLTGQELAVND